jgi:hypothetical protein
MKETAKEMGKKRGFWAAIKESMTKTGGCCGSGGDCCGPSEAKPKEKQVEKEPAVSSRCDDDAVRGL